jgi:hypothetical protein
VTFKNGAVVQREGETEFRVTWPGGKSQYVNELSYDALHRAYHLAMCGPPPPPPRSRPRKQQPSGDGSKFGDDPPF